METILVLSDDPAWRDTVVAKLTAAGHKARAAKCQIPPDDPVLQGTAWTAVLLDARDEPTCLSRLGKLRQTAGFATPFVLPVLAVRTLGNLTFTAGFDDFVTEPFAAEEVVARVRQLRWRANRTDDADLLKAGDLIVNLASCEVSIKGIPLPLTYQEYQLLRYLLAHRGRVFTREQLLSELWGYNYYGGTRTVDVHVRRLRAKLGPEHQDLIQTVRNVGYRFSRNA